MTAFADDHIDFFTVKMPQLAKSSPLEKLLTVDQFIIGQEVYNECVIRGKEKGEKDALLIEHVVNNKKITIREAQASLRKKLEHTFGITGGENETVALAVQEQCRMVIVDDKKGIIACKILTIPFMIALDVIVDLYENKRVSLSQAQHAFDRIKHFGWIRDDIIKTREKRLRRR